MIVIAGGTKGIGLEIAAHYAAHGDELLIVFARDARAAGAARERLLAVPPADPTKPVRVTTVQADIGSLAGCEVVASAVRASGGTVDIVVHSAVHSVAGSVLDADPEVFAKALDVNGLSLLWLVRALFPHLTRGSSVVYLSSRGGRVVIPQYAAVGVAKALAESLMRYLATELAPHGIRVNAVSPSIVDTEAVRTLFGDQTDALLKHAAEQNPTGRAIVPADYTAVVDFLTSPAAAFVQGQVIYVNGGSNLMA